MKYEIKTSTRLLASTGTLPTEYKPHPLKGDHKGQWECSLSQTG